MTTPISIGVFYFQEVSLEESTVNPCHFCFAQKSFKKKFTNKIWNIQNEPILLSEFIIKTKCMFIKLTHKGRPTLINMNNVVSIYVDTDVKQQKRLVKLTFTNSNVVFVDESLQEVYETYERVMNGEKQGIDWTYVPTFDERMEESFNNDFQPRQSYRPRQRMYKNYNQF